MPGGIIKGVAMADERLDRIEKKHTVVEQWVWKTISTAGLGFIIWYLSGINESLAVLKDDIVLIKLSDSANSIRMKRLEDDVVNLQRRVTDVEKTKADK